MITSRLSAGCLEWFAMVSASVWTRVPVWPRCVEHSPAPPAPQGKAQGAVCSAQFSLPDPQILTTSLRSGFRDPDSRSLGVGRSYSQGSYHSTRETRLLAPQHPATRAQTTERLSCMSATPRIRFSDFKNFSRFQKNPRLEKITV